MFSSYTDRYFFRSRARWNKKETLRRSCNVWLVYYLPSHLPLQRWMNNTQNETVVVVFILGANSFTRASPLGRGGVSYNITLRVGRRGRCENIWTIFPCGRQWKPRAIGREVLILKSGQPPHAPPEDCACGYVRLRLAAAVARTVPMYAPAFRRRRNISIPLWCAYRQEENNLFSFLARAHDVPPAAASSSSSGFLFCYLRDRGKNIREYNYNI